jgi:cupredoxin-like protein
MLRLWFCFALTSLLTLGAAPAGAQEISITIKDHKFQPTELKVPAKKRIVLTVINADATPEEFESKVLKVEKVIPGKSKAIVRFGPLEPGRYEFVGEFHEDTAKGVVIAE